MRPGGQVSHEMDTFAAAPDVEIVTLGGARDARPADRRRPLLRLPYLGATERWTAALAWYRDLQSLDLATFDAIVTLELFGATSDQAIRLGQRHGVPVVVQIAEMLEDKFLYRVPPWRRFTRHVVDAGALFVCDTEMAAAHAVALGCPRETTVVVAPGVDTERFRPAPALTTEPVVVTVGALRPGKGIPDVVRAVDRVAQRVPDVRLVVVGDGPLRPELDRLAATRPHVEVRGSVPRDEIAAELRRARLFATAPYDHRGWAEQFGFALVEAMACGLPVVATDNGVLRDVVPAPNPLVPQRDVDALADAIVRGLGDDAEERGSANRRAAVERFDLHTQAIRLRTLLDTHLR